MHMFACAQVNSPVNVRLLCRVELLVNIKLHLFILKYELVVTPNTCHLLCEDAVDETAALLVSHLSHCNNALGPHVLAKFTKNIQAEYRSSML